MKYIKSIIPVLFMTTMISCGNMSEGGDNGGDGGEQKPKTFATAEEAAKAAQADMVAAADNVNFGVDKEKLRSSAPGKPIMKQQVDFNMLLAADSAATLESMAKGEAVIAVPLIIGPEVVSIVTLRSENNQFGIGTLGDKQLSTELNMVSQINNAMPEVAILEVPNLNATVYAVKDTAGASRYHTTYNNNSIRQPMRAPELIRMLRADAEAFQKQFGDEPKKGKLVR